MTFKKIQLRIAIAVCVIFTCLLLFNIFPWSVFEPPVRADKVVPGKSNAINLKRTYERWMVEYSASSPPGPVISLVWNKGLSSEFTRARGIAEINLEKGIVRVRIKGLDDHNISEVWLIDNMAGPGREKRRSRASCGGRRL